MRAIPAELEFALVALIVRGKMIPEIKHLSAATGACFVDDRKRLSENTCG